LARLGSHLRPDGRLRVPGLIGTDPCGRELIELSAGNREARVAVRLPAPPAHNLTEATLYALDGDSGDDSAEPCLGIDVTADGNQAVVVDVTPTRWGGWGLRVSAPIPDDRS
jgi:hypothetical protein